MITRNNGRLKVVIGSLLLVPSLVMVLAWGHSGRQKAEAHFSNGHGIDFSISASATVGGPELCDSGPGGLPDTCTFILGQSVVVNIKLNSKGDLLNYTEVYSKVAYVGIVPLSVHNGPGGGNWPDCVTDAAVIDTGAAQVKTYCDIGFGAPGSTYTGRLAQNEFQCTQDGTVTLRHGPGNSALTDAGDHEHGETGSSLDSLTIRCEPALGGVASYPGLSSASNVGLFAGVGGAGVAVVLLGATGWYARKRPNN